MQQPLELEDNLGILGQMSGLQKTDESIQQFENGNLDGNFWAEPSEAAMMKMWNRMKSLEGKYIELANFYKQQLVTNFQPGSQPGSDATSKSAVGGVVNPATLNIQQQNSRMSDFNEDVIINELKAEKIRLEQNFKAIIEAGSLGNQPGGMNAQGSSESITVKSDQITRFNNELQGAFKDIMDFVDQSQNQAINNLGARQTEMFQLSTKYRMPSGFKNDAIGVWYDAKTSVTQAISQLKQFVQEKNDSVMAQTFTSPNNDKEQLNKQDYFKLIEKFEEDMVALKQGTKQYSKSLAKIKQTLHIHDESMKRDQQTVRADYEDLTDAITSTNDIMQGRKSLLGGDSLTGSLNENSINEGKISSTQPRASGSGNRKASTGAGNVTSPFNKRMSNYTQNALNRSNSRGGNNFNVQKPPKLGGGRKASANGAMSSPFGKKASRQDYDYHPDLSIIVNRLKAYDQSVSLLLAENATRSQDLELLVQKVDDQIQNNISKFLASHDTDLVKNFFTNTILTPTETAQIVAKANLNAHQKPTQSGKSPIRTSVSPYRGNRIENQFGNRKSTPTRNFNRGINGTPTREFGNSGKFGATGNQYVHELQTNTDQLFNELRRSNDKYIEQQVENRKLKDKVQVLQLQVEDLRIHNNRYQLKAQRDKSAGVLRKTKTTRATSSFGNDVISPNRIAGQSVISSGAYSNPADRKENDELIAEQSDLCKQIDQFFSAMKLLQRAVNRKEDISELKVEFETKQRGLQKTSKNIQARIKSQSQGAKLKRQPQDGSYERNSSNQNEPIRNRSQNARINGTGAISSSSKQMATSHRQPTSPLRAHTNQIRPKTSKAGIISPKPSIPTSSRLGIEKQQSANTDINSKASANKQQLDHLEQNLKSTQNTIAALQETVRMTQTERDQLERIIYNHKEAFTRFEQEVDIQKQNMPHQLYLNFGDLIKALKQDLDQKEKQQMPQRPLATMQYEVQEKLMAKIMVVENNQVLKYQKLQNKLSEREKELDQVKKLFVEKLRELESNFAEIGDHIEAQKEQQANSKELKLQAQASSLSQKEHKLVLDNTEQDDKALEDLVKTNSQLLDQVDELKQKLKMYMDPEESLKLKEDLNKLDEQVRMLTKEKEHLVKMFNVLSNERDSAQEESKKIKQEKQLISVDLSKQTQIAQALKLEKEEQEMKIQEQIKEIQIQINDEKEQKLTFQKEAQQNGEQIKAMEEELNAMQNQLGEQEMERAKDKFQIEDLQEKLKTEVEKGQDEAINFEEFKALTAKYDELELKHEITIDKFEKQKETEEELQKVLAELEVDAQARQDKLVEVEELLTRETDRVVNKEQELEESKKLIEKLEEQIEELQEEFKKSGQSALEQKSDEEEQIKTLKENLKKLQAEGEELEQKIQKADEEKSQFATQKAKELEDASKAQAKLEKENAEIQQAKEQALLEVQSQSQRVAAILDESENEKRKNWWMTALNLKVKNMIMKQIENHKKEQEELRLAMNDLKADSQTKQDEHERAMAELEADSATRQEKLVEVQELLTRETDKVVNIKQELEEKNQVLHKSQIKMEEDLEANIKAKEQAEQLHSETVSEKENQIQSLNNEIKDLKESHSSQLQNLTEGNSATEALQESLTQQSKDLDKKTESLKQLQNLKDVLQKQLDQQIEETKKVSDQMSEAAKKAVDRELMQGSLFAEKQKELDEIQKKMQLADEGSKKDKVQIDEQKERIEELLGQSDQLTKFEEIRKALEAEKEDLQQQMLALKNSSDEQTSSHQKELSELKEIQEAETKEMDLILKEQVTKVQSKETEVNELELELGGMKTIIEKNKQQMQEQKDKHEKEIKDIIAAHDKTIDELKQKDLKVKEESESKMRNEISNLEQEITDLTKMNDLSQKKFNSEIVSLNQQIKNLEDQITKLNQKEDQYKQEINKFEQEEANYKKKLEDAHKDMSEKVDSGHDNVKKIVDIHKTNEDLSQQLLEKVEQNKSLEKKVKETEEKVEDIKKSKQELENDFANQKQAYEVLLDSMAGFEASETKLNEEIKQLQIVKTELEDKCEHLMAQNKDMDEKIEELEKNQKGVTRNSIGSDGEEYNSVEEMRNHLKHARQILTQFIQKLPYSAQENEATLPVIYSILEFSKEEQDQLHKKRAEFNGQVEKMNDKVKSSLKGKFTSLIKKGKSNTDTGGSFNSGSNNTGQSNRDK